MHKGNRKGRDELVIYVGCNVLGRAVDDQETGEGQIAYGCYTVQREREADGDEDLFAAATSGEERVGDGRLWAESRG